MECDNVEVCTKCESPYIIDNSTHKCKCSTGYFVTGLCLDYPGCLAAYPFLTGNYCDKCDKDLRFIPTADRLCEC